MTNVFLYGTLCHPDLLELVAGCEWTVLGPEPVVCHGYRVVWAEGHGFPLILEAQGSAASGLLLRDVAQHVLERLNYYELGFGYDLVEVEVESAAGREPAKVYIPQPGLWQAGAPWSLEDWVQKCWPLTRHSAGEVMGYFGVLSGEEVAQRFKMILTRAASRVLAEEEAKPASVRSNRGRGAVTLEQREANHRGFFLLNTLSLSHERFDGAMSETLQREVFVAGDAATVLPYDPVRDRVLLIEQFRMGPYERGDKAPWMLEPIAGRIDGFETPRSTAEREAVEEAGLRLERLEPIASYYGTPGYSTEMFYSFIGIADLPKSAAGMGGVEDEHEDIRSHVVSFNDAMALIDSGEANNGPLILSLLWLAKERARLMAQARG
ncbi:NUDIX domain-containing protein [Rhodobacteraceae bacterium D3-12]|nr:NUDIX domain-containing protein [Rhodobacteraceae bacterium D3-12]